MNRMIALMLASVVAVGFVGAAKPARPAQPPAAKPPPPKATEVHEYKEQNIKFTTPGSWDSQGQGCHGSFCVLTSPSRPFSYVPKPGKKDPPIPPSYYGACFIAANDPANDGKELDAAIEAFQKEMQAAVKEMTFTPTADATLAGEPARAYVASYKQEMGDGEPAVAKKESAVFVAHNKRVYAFFMQGTAVNFDRDKAALDRVIKSVKWLDADARPAEAAADKKAGG